ncbi:MAG: shikimate dehydrogenase [Chloroflexaceae bacterium]|nr:shikimate dehydrogenase [Chloroflexaceae bacterium]NJO05344.1 shikimate dehydrogenase [Chloroflexaceae bacterium]
MARYRVGIIGDPVAHSRSPAMHNAAFVHLGIDAVYERWQTSSRDLKERIRSLRAADMLGASVTLPHKAAVMALLDDLEPQAARIGAVNTIYKPENGRLVGANTDAPGFIESLHVDAAFDPAGSTVLILGASGAARAALYALLDAGASRLVIANRTLERAEALLADVLSSGMAPEDGSTNGTTPAPLVDDMPDAQLIAVALDDTGLPDLLAESTLIVNATSLGWHGDETPLPEARFSPGTLVYDMVYRPTRLLHDAAAQGAHTLDGMGMLLRQGTLAFEHWTGQPAPLDVMRAALQHS